VLESMFELWTVDDIEGLLVHIEANEPEIMAAVLRHHRLDNDANWLAVARLQGRGFLEDLASYVVSRLAAVEHLRHLSELWSVYHLPRFYNLKTRVVRVGAAVLASSRRGAESKASKQLCDDEMLLGFE
jgi:hypothetical protein